MFCYWWNFSCQQTYRNKNNLSVHNAFVLFLSWWWFHFLQHFDIFFRHSLHLLFLIRCLLFAVLIKTWTCRKMWTKKAQSKVEHWTNTKSGMQLFQFLIIIVWLLLTFSSVYLSFVLSSFLFFLFLPNDFRAVLSCLATHSICFWNAFRWNP